MRKRTALMGLAVLSCGGFAFAQTTPTDQRLDQFEQRLNELEKKHQADLKQRDDEIARLKAQLDSRPSPSADAIEKTKQDVLKDIESRDSGPFTLRTPASFNPDIAVITNFQGNVSTNNANPARNRFDVGSVELDFRAAVDPRADAVAVIPFIREVHDPLFPEADAENEIEGGVEIEEAYLFLHDFGVPNLTAKLGRFHLRFGRQNVLHAHDWATADNAFVNQSFLGAEALTDNGLSLSYVIPPAWIGGQYVEAIVEVVSGEGGGEESPVLNNDASVDSPALNTHLLWNTDVTKDWNLELGASWLMGKHDNDNQLNVNLFGADLTLVHTDPTGGFGNTLFQAEAIYGNVDTADLGAQNAFGIYGLVQQQLNRDWYAGLRVDWTQNAVDDSQEVWGVSPYVSWYWSEFLRFRVEYQHKDGDVEAEDTVFFQATWIFGAHPPHPYWAMR